MYALNNDITYFYSFGVECIPKEIKKFINGSTIRANIYRMQAYDPVICRYFCIGFIDFMLKGKSITDFNNLFSPNNFFKNDDIILNYFKMGESANMYPNLNHQQQFRFNEINKIKDYFIAEIRERELMSKRLSKYIASFDYFNKSLIVLSARSPSISIALFATVTGAPVRIASANFSFAFSMTTGTVKKLLKTTRAKKKKHNKIVMLARSKLNSIESKISKAFIDNEISHEDFETIINGEKNYLELKESIIMIKSQRSDTKKKVLKLLNITRSLIII